MPAYLVLLLAWRSKAWSFITRGLQLGEDSVTVTVTRQVLLRNTWNCVSNLTKR